MSINASTLEIIAAIITKCLSGKLSYDSLRLSSSSNLVVWIENKNTKKGNAMYYPRFTKLVVNFVMDKDPSIPRRNKVNWHYARDDPMFTTINVISRNEGHSSLYGAILPVALTNEDIRNSESYKEYYAIASGTIPPKTKGSKKKANTDTITKQKPPTAPKEKKSGKRKARSTTELETISEADLTEAEQLKIIKKEAVKKLIALMPVVLEQMKGNWCYNTRFLMHQNMLKDELSGNQVTMIKMMSKLKMMKMQIKMTLMRLLGVKKMNDDHDDNEKETDEDDDEDSDNEVEGANVEGAKSDEDATYEYKPRKLKNTHGPLTLRLKALEDNFSELRQTNQYAEALSSIPGIVDQYLANKMQEAVEVRPFKDIASYSIIDAYEADKILPGVQKKKVPGKEPASTSAPSETTTTTAGKTTTTGSKTHKKSASQSAPVEEADATNRCPFEATCTQSLKQVSMLNKQKEEVQHLPNVFQQPTRLTFTDIQWNKSVPAFINLSQPAKQSGTNKEPSRVIQ
ncbi:hypothetical protein Tco_1371284 [Tanacetum coccineum]